MSAHEEGKGVSKIWSCKIGELDSSKLPMGADAPLRMAVRRAYEELTGEPDMFTFSGWGAELTDEERAVVERYQGYCPKCGRA